MNANELADELLKVVNVSSHVKMCTSDMLKRQQAEIEKITKLMNFWKESYNELRTHPADLTDEEMYELLEKYQGIELCKAVLRKAQEK